MGLRLGWGLACGQIIPPLVGLWYGNEVSIDGVLFLGAERTLPRVRVPRDIEVAYLLALGLAAHAMYSREIDAGKVLVMVCQ